MSSAPGSALTPTLTLNGFFAATTAGAEIVSSTGSCWAALAAGKASSATHAAGTARLARLTASAPSPRDA